MVQSFSIKDCAKVFFLLGELVRIHNFKGIFSYFAKKSFFERNSMIKRILTKLHRKVFGKSKNSLDHFLYAFKSEIGNFSTVFDVGAYHGNFINEVLKLNKNLAVHAFEPFGESFQIIQERFIRQAKVVLNHVAVSDVAGEAVLHVNAFKETNSLLPSASVNQEIDKLTQYESGETVAIISLDEYCRNNGIAHIDLVKIDTQGNSFQVLKGMDALLANQRIKYLYVEAEFVEIYKGEKLFSEIEILMRQYGYSIVNLYNLNYINNRLSWCDVLFSLKN